MSSQSRNFLDMDQKCWAGKAEAEVRIDSDLINGLKEAG
jgi:hypothetical protein